MYTDNTLLTWGPHKFTKLCRVPADYLMDIYNKKTHDKQLTQYIKDNFEKIKARLEGKITAPELDLSFRLTKTGIQLLCQGTDKIIFPSEKEAKQEIKRISYMEQKQKKPQRAYECATCGGWHLTSISFEEWQTLKPQPNTKH